MEKAVTALSFSDKEKLALAIAKSNLFGMKTPEQALVLMSLCEAEGMHPVIAVRDYHIIQGRPALKSDALLARFQQAGGRVEWKAYTDSEVTGIFSHPQGGTVTVSWTMAQAKAANLTSKDVWKQYPRAMLRARVISEAIRTVYPGVSVGVYTVEEVQDFDSKPETREVQAEVEAPKKLEPAPKLPTADPERAELFAKLKKSEWTKEELSKYSETAWGVGSAANLLTEQLKLLVAMSSSTPYKEAIEAEEAMKQLGMELERE